LDCPGDRFAARRYLVVNDLFCKVNRKEIMQLSLLESAGKDEEELAEAFHNRQNKQLTSRHGLQLHWVIQRLYNYYN